MHGRQGHVLFRVHKETELFLGLSGEYSFSSKDLVSILDKATDDSNGSYNPHLRRYTKVEAERLSHEGNSSPDKNWRDAKHNLARKILSFFCQYRDIDEHILCLRFGELLENGAPSPSIKKPLSLQKPKTLLTYLLKNFPKS